MKYTTDTRDRRGVERAVEGILYKWATGDTAAQTSIYVTKLRLTAEDLRQETQASNNWQTKKPSERVPSENTQAGKRMGHAGALISGGDDTAEAKLAIMEACGFTVTRNPSEMAKLLKGLL